MVEPDSDQAKLFLANWKYEECICVNETIYQEKHVTGEELETKSLAFVFPITEAAKCKEFLKRCHDDESIKLDLSKVTIETRIRQLVDKRVYGLDENT
jgi:hypothetical protein